MWTNWRGAVGSWKRITIFYFFGAKIGTGVGNRIGAPLDQPETPRVPPFEVYIYLLGSKGNPTEFSSSSIISLLACTAGPVNPLYPHTRPV